MKNDLHEITANVTKARALLDMAVTFGYSSDRSVPERFDTIMTALEAALALTEEAETALFSTRF